MHIANSPQLGGFEKLTQEKLSDMIVRQIKTMIEDGTIKSGDRLPPERELTKLLNVSRIPLREALKSLQQINVLEVRQNRYYVLGLESAKLVDYFSDATSDHSLHEEIKEVRIVVEIAAVELACKHRTNADIERMKKSLQQMEAMVAVADYPSIIKFSMQFHDDIIEACGNRLFIAIMAAMSAALYEGRKKTLEHADRYISAVKEHKDILECIIRRDCRTARTLMKSHLETAYY